MSPLRFVSGALLAAVLSYPAFAADDILEAIDGARKAYQAGDMGTAKQSLDVASQLIAQKNAEGFVALLPAPLSGWQAEKAQTTAVGASILGGASAASRNYTNAKGDNIDVTITGDSAMLSQFAPMLANPALAGAMGKLVKIGDQRGIQTNDGDVLVLVGNKFLVNVTGSGDAASKLAYAQAVDIAKLSKM
jgi:dihydroxyacetone kinase DhaKLM complex PTS-EIIA-like component DhaM